MVALLLYGYATKQRSARAIERSCRQDVAYRVMTANWVPDHATIARFVVCHEAALAGLFRSVLALCAKAGLVSSGVVAIDGTKLTANASREANSDYERIAREIIAEAKATDEAEDELFGEARGDELPEDLRKALADESGWAKPSRRSMRSGRRIHHRPLRSWPKGHPPSRAGGPWTRAAAAGCATPASASTSAASARRALVPRSREARLAESRRRLEEELGAEREANDAYEAYRSRGISRDGRRFGGGPPSPHRLPDTPAGKINTTDPDRPTSGAWSRWSTRPPASLSWRASPRPTVAVADAGYWHHEQMDSLAADRIQVLIPPDAGKRKGARPGWQGGRYEWMRTVLATELGQRLYRTRSQTVEPVFGHTKHNRGMSRFHRRGRSAVRTEWRLIAATHNLMKLHSHAMAAAAV